MTNIQKILVEQQNDTYDIWILSPPPVKPEGTIGLHSVCLLLCHSVCHSVCHTSFPDFSWLCFHISEWKLVASFCMKSYRSSSTFVTVDLLFHELLPFFKIHFPDFSWLCFYISEWISHIWMKVGSKLPYGELQIKFDFRHCWPTCSWVIVLCSKFIFRIFFWLCFHISEWKLVASFRMKSYRSSLTFITVELLFNE